jgi:hypothetical protein
MASSRPGAELNSIADVCSAAADGYPHRIDRAVPQQAVAVRPDRVRLANNTGGVVGSFCVGHPGGTRSSQCSSLRAVVQATTDQSLRSLNGKAAMPVIWRATSMRLGQRA